MSQEYYSPAENPLKPPPIFIGGLPALCYDPELKQFAENFGPVIKAIVKMDFQTGRSRGFGFVEFEHFEHFNDILAADPSRLTIQGKLVEARQFEKGAKPKSKLNFSDPPTESELTCFVGAMPQICDDAMLLEYCSGFGQVESATVKMDPETGRSRGFGFVKFVSPEGVSAITDSYLENMIDDKWIDVKQVAEKGAGGSKGGSKGGFDKGSKGGYGKGGKGGFADYGKGGYGMDYGYNGMGYGNKGGDKGYGKKMDKGFGGGKGKGKSGGKKGGKPQASWDGPQKRAAPY